MIEKVSHLEKCYVFAHNPRDANITQAPNLGRALGRRGYPFSLTIQTLQLSPITEELHALWGPGMESLPSSFQGRAMSWKCKMTLAWRGDCPILEMAGKTKSDSYLTPYMFCINVSAID